MGFEKTKRPLLAPGGKWTVGNATANAGQISNFQALTGGSTGTIVTNEGVTRILVGSTEGTASGILPFRLANPIPGVLKTIIVDSNSTKIIHVRTQTSTTGFNFYGSTKNALVWTTGGTGPPPSIDLIGVSTSVWAVKTYVSTSTAIADRVGVVGATA